ncbi:hypothetical protein MRB53_025848 [Persea americana]|uniref:Uncharacterized protein n=1 Tax=Persea americana TaxID=3435 RepID=A0ACC2LGK8_PERAE|nr:hypothetical protein MRB53_025848 [Persea americana]
MKKEVLDIVLVPLGFSVMVAYHIWLFYRILKHPMKTVVGINAATRLLWVQTMMQDTSKNGILAVQTLRNNIMASTLLASMAIMLSSLIALLISGGTGMSEVRSHGLVYGDSSDLGFAIKAFSILLCFLVSFLFNVQSIRYYSHANILINVRRSPYLSADYVGRALNRGGYFWSLGLRAFYFSLPMFLWMFGPIPMFVCCLVLVFLLFFLDMSFDCRVIGDEKDEEEC